MVDVEAADRLIGLSTNYTDYTDCALLAASNRSWDAPTHP